jgi:hypothetical protein
MAVLVNETMMLVKAGDSFYVTSILRMMLVPTNNSFYSRTLCTYFRTQHFTLWFNIYRIY